MTAQLRDLMTRRIPMANQPTISATFINHNGIHARTEAILGDGKPLITIIMSKPGSYRFPGKIDKTMQQLTNLFTPEFFKHHSIQILNLVNILDEADIDKPMTSTTLTPTHKLKELVKGEYIWKAWGNLDSKHEAYKIAEKIANLEISMFRDKTVFTTPNPYACQYKGKVAADIEAVLKSLFPTYT